MPNAKQQELQAELAAIYLGIKKSILKEIAPEGCIKLRSLETGDTCDSRLIMGFIDTPTVKVTSLKCIPGSCKESGCRFYNREVRFEIS